MSRKSLVMLATFTVLFAVSTSLFAQVSVTAANPSTAVGGTVNLNVTISGSGFKKGAKSQFFKTGTTDPGDVVVNSTTFNSSSQVVANISVSSTASTSNYDIQVMNANGSSGKGTELFGVQSGTGTNGVNGNCTTTGTPSGFTLITLLNPVNASTGGATLTTGFFGNGIAVRPVDLDHNGTVDTLATMVTSGKAAGSEATYVFFLDPATGTLQSNNPITGAPWQNPIVVLSGSPAGPVAAGDVNGDGVPDFLTGTGNGSQNGAYLFVGSVNATTYNLTYTAYNIPAPAGSPAWFGASGNALGDLDGDGRDEIAIGANATGAKGKGPLPTVYIYKFNGSALGAPFKTIVTPSGTYDGFGSAVAIGNIDGNTNNNRDLAISATGAANGTSGSGAVYVYQGPVLTQSSYFTLVGPGTQFGWGVAIGEVDHDSTVVQDLIVTNSPNSTPTAAMLYTGPVSGTSTYFTSMQPVYGLSDGWDWPNMDLGNIGTVGAVLVGAPNANNSGSSCNTYVGAAHLFVGPFSGGVQMTNYLFEPPSNYLGGAFGYGVAIANGYPFVLVGAHIATVGTTSSAGQVFVYKMN